MAERLPAPLVRFIADHLRSVWALELLLILMRDPERPWTVPELVREMRASAKLVEDVLARFTRDGLATRADGPSWRWSPADAERDERAHQLAEAYRQTPFAVVQTIAETPASAISDFADAFRLRGDKERK